MRIKPVAMSHIAASNSVYAEIINTLYDIGGSSY